ncbi:MAG: DUF2344 domain-containing protein [Holophaga sp.]|nr:DUF2344 domain-containing protein [Holophaga sp.]
MRVSDSAPAPENPTLKAFQDLLHEDTPEAAALEALLARILAEQSAGKALHFLNRSRPRSNSPKEPRWHAARTRLEAAVEAARNIRLHTWQLDPNRRTVRFQVEIRHPASDLNPSALGHLLAELLLKAGCPAALGLEKKPRPMITLGPPLPLGVEGLCEWMDAVLQAPPRVPMEPWVMELNALCPSGFHIRNAHPIPNHSSALVDLAREAHWRWDIPADLFQQAADRIQAFGVAKSFTIEKSGKVGGTKTLKRLEVRGLVTRLDWHQQSLHFSTRLQLGEGLSPIKLLAGILEVEPACIKGLTRLEVTLAEDARLAQAQKYEPKLHNIYEDAVLLESGDIPMVMDDDEDDGLLIRR